MTHYLEDFTELLPAAPDKEATIADFLKRAEDAGFEEFLLQDCGKTKRCIDEKVKYATRTRLDTRVQDAMIADGFTEAEITRITDSCEDIEPEFMDRIRAVIVKLEAIDCAALYFDKKERAHDRMLREMGGKDAVVKIVKQLASKKPALAGPKDMHALDEMIAELHASAPWLREISTWAHKSLRAQYDAGRMWLRLPPVILLGPPGSGKSTYARKLATLSGTSVRALDAAASGASFAIAGSDSTWSSAQAGIPLQEIANTGIANPIIIVDEIDKCGRAMTSGGTRVSLPDALLGLLEPSSSHAWECPFTRRSFNMSQISWVLTANDIDGIFPPLLDRCRVFHVEYPAPDDLAHLIRAQASGRIFDEVADLLIERALKATSKGKQPTLRRLQQLIDEAADVSTAPVLH